LTWFEFRVKADFPGEVPSHCRFLHARSNVQMPLFGLKKKKKLKIYLIKVLLVKKLALALLPLLGNV
jgi:hypothetical protein